jgi:hypothetical protein
MMTAADLYRLRCGEHHNIDQHLPIIRAYASLCSHVTELGVDRGFSTSALLASGAATVRGYDLVRLPEVDLLEQVAAVEGIDFKFVLGDSRKVVIEPTELLLVDTDHTYDQVTAELRQHSNQVSRFLIFHDVHTFPDIVPAIREHCSDHWALIHWSDMQHGLAIYERMHY